MSLAGEVKRNGKEIAVGVGVAVTLEVLRTLGKGVVRWTKKVLRSRPRRRTERAAMARKNGPATR